MVCYPGSIPSELHMWLMPTITFIAHAISTNLSPKSMNILSFFFLLWQPLAFSRRKLKLSRQKNSISTKLRSNTVSFTRFNSNRQLTKKKIHETHAPTCEQVTILSLLFPSLLPWKKKWLTCKRIVFPDSLSLFRTWSFIYQHPTSYHPPIPRTKTEQPQSDNTHTPRPRRKLWRCHFW